MLKRLVLGLAAAAGLALASVPATTTTAEAGWKHGGGHKWHGRHWGGGHRWHGHRHWGGHRWHGRRHWGGVGFVIGPAWGYPYYGYGPYCTVKVKYKHHWRKVRRVCY